MQTLSKVIYRYQLYFRENEYWIRDCSGYWRVICKTNQRDWEISIREKKPEEIDTFRLVTIEELDWDKIFQGYFQVIYIVRNELTISRHLYEAMEILRRQIDHLNKIKKRGWQIKGVTPEGHLLLEIPLLEFDIVYAFKQRNSDQSQFPVYLQ